MIAEDHIARVNGKRFASLEAEPRKNLRPVGRKAGGFPLCAAAKPQLPGAPRALPPSRALFASNKVKKATNKALFAPDKVKEATNKPLFAPDKVKEATNKAWFALNKVKKATNKALFASNKVKASTNKPLLASNKVKETANKALFAPNKVTETTNKAFLRAVRTQFSPWKTPIHCPKQVRLR
jgi:hypothetical protein